MANGSPVSKSSQPIDRDTRTEAQLLRLKQRFLTKGGNGVATPVVETDTTVDITFSMLEPNIAYGVVVTPNWDTRWWVTDKAVDGFTAHFSSAAPADATIDWSVFRS